MDAPTGIVTLVFVEGPEGPPTGGPDLRRAIAAAGGFQVKSSAGAWMAAFAASGAALRFVLASQLAAGAAGLRAGIATGEAIVERDAATGRADYFGPIVNRAARLMTAAHPGQTLLSEAARAAAPAEVALRDLGEHRLRGIERPERLYLALPDAWRGRDFPPLLTLRTSPTNLPPQTSGFVGREHELAELARVLEDPAARVVTITGGAGVGKTRLAVRAASAFVDRIPGGVWFADLAEERGAEGIARAVAEGLGVTVTGAAPVAAVGASIEARGRVLLVLDTFDVHLPDAAATVGAWSARAPDATFLLTSRTLTGLPGERELRLDSLPPAAAVRLFADRAREARPDFELGPENEADVARICSELEGLPLAIELAAARARILKPSEMVRKLGQKFQLLRSVRKDAAPRQQTLTAAIEWSEEQLTPWELSALRQMTVFCGGCTPEAADAVIDLSGHPGAPGGAAAARALVARSLLSARESDQATRFVMSRTLHEHSLAHLPAEGPEGRKAAESRHAAWCVRFAAYLDSHSGQRESRDLAREEIENFFAVQDRLGGQEDRALDVARVIASTRTSLLWHGPLKEGLERMTRARAALGSPEEPETRMRLMLGEARLQKALGRWKEALDVADEAARFGKSSGATALLSEVLWEVAYLAGSFSEYDRSDAALAESEAMARAAGNRVRLMSCLHLRTVRMRGRGDVAGSLALAREALEISREIPSREDALAESLNVVANVLGEASDPAGAFAMYREAIEIDERLGNEAGRATRLGNSGDVLLEMGELSSAMDFYMRAGEVDRRLGRQAYLTYGLIRQSSVLRVQGDCAGALALLDRASEGLGRLGSPQLRAIWTLRRLEILFDMGDDAGVVRLFEESARDALIDQDLPKVLAANAIGARALVRLGRAAEAHALLARVLKDGVPGSLPDVDRFGLFAVRALVAEAAGEFDEARRLGKEAAELGAKLRVNYGARNPTLADLGPVVERIARG